MSYTQSAKAITLTSETGTDGRPISGTLLTLGDPSDATSVTLFFETERGWRMATVVSVTSEGRSGRPLPPWDDDALDAPRLPAFGTPFMVAVCDAARALGACYIRVLDYTEACSPDYDAHFRLFTKPPQLDGQLHIAFQKFGVWRPTTDLRELVAAAALSP